MGDILQSLLGGSQSLNEPAFSTNTIDMLTGMGGFAGPISGSQSDIASQIANAYPSDVSGEIPQAAAISVKGWKPKEQSVWGKLADIFLERQGDRPYFADKLRERNFQKAMEGFTQEPLEAIRKMSQIPGMQEKAWNLYNQVIDNQRADGTLARQNRALDMRNDDYIYQQTAGMMGAARPDTWAKMRELAIQRGNARGVDVSSFIPEQYDPDAIEYIRYGAVKPKDQMTLEERRENNQARVGIQRDRLTETQRHNRASESQQAANEAGRDERSRRPRPSSKGEERVVMTPGGRQVVIHPNGRVAVATDPDGTKHVLEKFGNGWKIRKPVEK